MRMPLLPCYMGQRPWMSLGMAHFGGAFVMLLGADHLPIHIT